MLASLLPGLRELRAPLAAGYTWIFGLWVMLRDLNIESGPVRAFREDITQLAAWIGKPALIGAVTFVAYIIGTVSISATHRMDEVITADIRTRGHWLLTRIKPNFHGKLQIAQALRDAAVNKLCNRFLEDEVFRASVLEYVSEVQIRAQREGRRPHEIIADVRIDHMRRSATKDYLYRWHLLELVAQLDPYVEAAKEDLDYIASRLLGKEDQLYGEYDRLIAEGNFRLGMSLPLAFVVLEISVNVSIWFAFSIVIPIVLLYVGSASWSAAERKLAVALAAERVDSPTLSRLVTDEIEFVPYHGLIVQRIEATSAAIRENPRLRIEPADRSTRPWGAPPPGSPKPK